MDIQFDCLKCGQLLTVPKAAAGRKCRCPSCETIAAVPGDAVSTDDAESHEAQAPSESGEAHWQMDHHDREAERQSNQTPRTGESDLWPSDAQDVSVNQVVQFGIDAFGREYLRLIAATIVATVLIVASRVMVSVVLDVNRLHAARTGDAGFTNLIVFFGENLFRLYLSTGYLQLCIRLTRRGKADLLDLFTAGFLVWKMVALKAIIGVMMLIGAAFFAVIGAFIGNHADRALLGSTALWCCFVLFVFWPAAFLVVDEREGVFAALANAPGISFRYWTTIFGLAAVSVFLMLIGVFTFGLGLLVTLPLMTTMWAAAYLMMSSHLPEALGNDSFRHDYR